MSTATFVKRYRTLLILAAISVAWKVVVLTLGSAVPRWVIGDGVAHLPADRRALGDQAKAAALTLWSHPVERLGIVRALRVMSVDSQPSLATAAAPACHVKARVRAYTYFAIPYSEAITRCDTGVVEYRVFRPAD